MYVYIRFRFEAETDRFIANYVSIVVSVAVFAEAGVKMRISQRAL